MSDRQSAPTGAKRGTLHLVGYGTSEMLAHLSRPRWLDDAGNSPLVVMTRTGAERLYAAPSEAANEEYRIEVTFTPDPEDSTRVATISLVRFATEGLLDKMLDEWHTGRSQGQRYVGLKFMGLERELNWLELGSAGIAWGKFEIDIADEESSRDWDRDAEAAGAPGPVIDFERRSSEPRSAAAIPPGAIPGGDEPLLVDGRGDHRPTSDEIIDR